MMYGNTVKQLPPLDLLESYDVELHNVSLKGSIRYTTYHWNVRKATHLVFDKISICINALSDNEYIFNPYKFNHLYIFLQKEVIKKINTIALSMSKKITIEDNDDFNVINSVDFNDMSSRLYTHYMRYKKPLVYNHITHEYIQTGEYPDSQNEFLYRFKDSLNLEYDASLYKSAALLINSYYLKFKNKMNKLRTAISNKIKKKKITENTVITSLLKNTPPSEVSQNLKKAIENIAPRLVSIERDRKLGKLGIEGFPTITPKLEDTLNCLKYIKSLDDVKVVIVGHQPYSEEGHSDGFAFSSKHPDKAPKTLKNIIEELNRSGIYKNQDTITNASPDTPYSLEPWAKQGVVLLNLSLTADSDNNDYSSIWETPVSNMMRKIFIDSYVRGRGKKKEDINKVVWVLLGTKSKTAYKRAGLPLGGNKFNTVLFTSHPCSRSYNRGFRGSNIFKMINDRLLPKDQIVW